MDLTLFLTLLFIGIVFVFIGILFIILSLIKSEEKTEKTQIDYGGVLIIGPLPIVFGSKTKIAIITLVLAIILTILSIFLFILTTGGLIK
ncbi:MAG: DUF131 domain-containing protein [Desulfurococcaceae archaeon]